MDKKPTERQRQMVELSVTYPEMSRTECYVKAFRPKTTDENSLYKMAHRQFSQKHVREYRESLLRERMRHSKELPNFSVNEAAQMLHEAHAVARGKDNAVAMIRAVEALIDLYGIGAKHEIKKIEDAIDGIVLLPTKVAEVDFETMARKWVEESDQRQQEMIDYVNNSTH